MTGLLHGLMTLLQDGLSSLVRAGRLPEAFAFSFMARGVAAVLILAPLFGALSPLVVARRLAFFSAALGHAAMTGLTIGIVLGEPINGAYGGIFGFCFLAALGMVYVRRRSALPPDTLIGVFLAMTLGLGICLLVAVTKQFNIHQVEAVMFGSLITVTGADLKILLAVAAGVGAVLAWKANDLGLDSLSVPLAKVAGVRPAFLEYLFVMLLTAAIVVSLKVIGALLVEALVIIPAASARNLARDARGYFAWSVAIALAGALGGLLVSALPGVAVPSGGAVVLALSGLFFVTLGAGAVIGRR